MRFRRLLRAIEKNRNEVRGILTRRYPAFVWSDESRLPPQPPAFVFHDAEPAEMEALLGYLADNGYATLTADEYAARVAGEAGGGHEVLLTFDDGLRSLYDAVRPSLLRFQLKAVAYVVSSKVPEKGAPDRPLCGWDEIREMHERGVVDVQSHSRFHQSVAVSSRIVDFVRPGLDLSFLSGDLAPMVAGSGESGDCDELPVGHPIHEWGSRFGDAPAFRESPSAIRASIEHVSRHGGSDFFQRRGWRAELTAVAARARRTAGDARFESEAEQRAAILEELTRSKEEIEARLIGKTVRHFCLPWFRGSLRSARLSAEAGYVTNAWGSLLPRFVAGEHVPIPIPRLPCWYVPRLPGKGRRPLADILRERWAGLRAGRRSSG